jgi:hypothetical protein
MSPSFEADYPEDKARYWWNVFRSVVFLERWVQLIPSRNSILIFNIFTAGLRTILPTNHALRKKI